MRRRLAGVRNVFLREVRLIWRDKTLLAVVLLAPLFYAVFYGAIYAQKAEHDVPMAVVDADRSALSRTLVRSLDAHPSVRVVDLVTDLDAARRALEAGVVQGVLYVPAGFEGSLRRGAGADLKAYLNASRFLVANDLNRALSEVTGTLAAGAKLRYFQARGHTGAQARALIEPVQAVVHPLFNPAETYGDFLIPGLLALILQQTLLIGVGVSVAKDREEGKLGRLYRLSGGSAWAILTGKGIFYVGLFALYAALFFSTMLTTYGLSVRGDLRVLAVLVALLLVAVASMGYLAASFFRRQITPLQFFVLTSYPFFLMSGYSWPLSAMPGPVRLLAQALPITPFMQAFVRVVQMGASWRHVAPDVVHLAALGAVYALLAYGRTGVLARHAAARAASV